MKKNFWFLGLLIGLLGCSGSDNTTLKKLQAAVENENVGPKGYNVIKLEDITDFEWDTAYFFQEATPVLDIRNEIGFMWDGTAVPNFHHRFLFVGKGKVVGFVDYNFKEEFPLSVYGCNQDRWIYPRSRATFASFKYCTTGEDQKTVYTFIPEPCVENIQQLMGQKCNEEKVATK